MQLKAWAAKPRIGRIEKEREREIKDERQGEGRIWETTAAQMLIPISFCLGQH